MVKAFIKMLNGFFEYLANSTIEFITSIFSYMGHIGEYIFSLPIVQEGILFGQTVALSFLVLKITYESIMIYLLRQNGDMTTDPNQLLIGSARAASIIACMPWIISYIIKFGLTVTSDVQEIDAIGQVAVDNSTFTLFINLLTQSSQFALLIAVGIIFSIVMLVIVLLQSFIRAADLAVESWFGCFAALGLTNSQSQSWTRWVWNMIAIAITPSIQLALIKLAFISLKPLHIPVNGNSVSLPGTVNLILFLAVIWVAYRTPNTVKEKMHTTGVGRVSGAITQMTTQSIVMRMVRK